MNLSRELDELGGGTNSRVGELQAILRLTPSNSKKAPLSSVSMTSNSVKLSQTSRSGQSKSVSFGMTAKYDDSFSNHFIRKELFSLKRRKSALKWVISGFNAGVVTYGEVGSGKSYTLFDTTYGPNAFIYCMKQLFKQKEASLTIGASFKEIICHESSEKLVDLLKIDSDKSIVVRDLEHAEDLYRTATSNSVNFKALQIPTNNKAHFIIRITLYNKDNGAVSNLYIVDLAGYAPDSNKILKLEINQLKSVLYELAIKKQMSHVMSTKVTKLAHILGPLIGGNSKTYMLFTLKEGAAFTSSRKLLELMKKASEISMPCVKVAGIMEEDVGFFDPHMADTGNIEEGKRSGRFSRNPSLKRGCSCRNTEDFRQRQKDKTKLSTHQGGFKDSRTSSRKSNSRFHYNSSQKASGQLRTDTEESEQHDNEGKRTSGRKDSEQHSRYLSSGGRSSRLEEELVPVGNKSPEDIRKSSITSFKRDQAEVYPEESAKINKYSGGKAGYNERSGQIGKSRYNEKSGEIGKDGYNERSGQIGKSRYNEKSGEIGKDGYNERSGQIGKSRYNEKSGKIGSTGYNEQPGTAGKTDYNEFSGQTRKTGYNEPQNFEELMRAYEKSKEEIRSLNRELQENMEENIQLSQELRQYKDTKYPTGDTPAHNLLRSLRTLLPETPMGNRVYEAVEAQMLTMQTNLAAARNRENELVEVLEMIQQSYEVDKYEINKKLRKSIMDAL